MSATATVPPPAAKPKQKLPPRGGLTVTAPTPAAKPEPPKLAYTPPGNERVDYGGKAAYVGAQVWYWHLNADSKKLEPRPAMPFERNYLNPDNWLLSVRFFAAGANEDIHNVPYSDEPKLAHWSWPIVPEVEKAKPPESPSAAVQGKP